MTSTSPSPSSSPSSTPVFPNPTPTSQPDQSATPPLDTSLNSAPPPRLPPPRPPVISLPPDISPPPPPPPPPNMSPSPPPLLYASPPSPVMLPPPLVASPPPPDTSPPPPSPVASPPPPDTSPPPPPVPPAPTLPSPATTKPSPPPVTATPPNAPTLSSPPPPLPSPPPSGGSHPPKTTASPPVPTPPGPTPPTPSLPPPQPRSPSPPPPKIIPSPTASTFPPPPHSNPPKHSLPNQNLTPPSSTSSPPSNTSTTQLIPPLPSVKPTIIATKATTTSSQNVTSGGSPSGPKTGGVVAISIVAGFVTLSLFLMAVWFKRRQKRRNHPHNHNHITHSPSTSSEKSDSQILRPHPLTGNSSLTNSKYSSDHGGVGNSRTWFTYEELAEATGGFAGSNLLGEGGFGCVYKGLLPDEREVAVKQLKIGGGQGEREFRAEVEIISRVHHRHLVSLVGYCISDQQRLLVYQYVPNNTLRYHLHDRPVMDWATRIRVAAGAARGLAYLHEDCHPRIIHRDIKSSNILLDDNFDAQVADFGLAKLAMDSNTHVTTRVMGTFGYLAPEYASSGKLTEKSDVFSFGVVLLELITGRKPVDASQPMGDEGLVEWARPLINHALETEEFEELVDPRLGKNYVRVEMFRMIEAAAACIRHLAPKRPRMSQVVRALDSIVECTTDLTNGMKVGQSEIIDSREQSAQIRLFQRMAFDGQDYASDYLNNSQTSWGS